jgi:hypothetical protein
MLLISGLIPSRRWQSGPCIARRAAGARLDGRHSDGYFCGREMIYFVG